MWNRKLGFVDQDVIMIGTPEVPIYLIRHGKTWTIVEGGLSTMAPRVFGQLLAMVEDLSLIDSWVITHAHYDHCGLLSTLYPLLPGVTVYGSKKTKKAFASTSAQKIIQHLNQSADTLWNLPDNRFTGPTHQIPLNEIPMVGLEHGETIHLGKLGKLVALETPGHSGCSMSFFAPNQEWLFTGDSLGELVSPGVWCPLVFDDYCDYSRSLKRMADLRLNKIFLGHHGVLSGEEARSAPFNAIQATNNFRNQAIQAAAQGERKLKAFAELMSFRYRHVSKNFVPSTLHQKSMLRMSRILSNGSKTPRVSGVGATSPRPFILPDSFRNFIRRSA